MKRKTLKVLVGKDFEQIIHDFLPVKKVKHKRYLRRSFYELVPDLDDPWFKSSEMGSSEYKEDNALTEDSKNLLNASDKSFNSEQIDGFSIIIPCETNRLPLLKKTLKSYRAFGLDDDIRIEFVIVSRSLSNNELQNIFASFEYRLVKYTFEGAYFNPSIALNLGVIFSGEDNIIIISPEVKPVTDVLRQLAALPRGNYICKVYNQEADGSQGIVLVDSKFRSSNPSMYFMTLFKREDLFTINGWDEGMMNGIGYEDNDFGVRFNRAGLKFECHDEIVGMHQYHPLVEVSDGWEINKRKFLENNRKNVVRPDRGLLERLAALWYKYIKAGEVA